eukprot:17678-Prymnesium_polylepis.2
MGTSGASSGSACPCQVSAVLPYSVLEPAMSVRVSTDAPQLVFDSRSASSRLRVGEGVRDAVHRLGGHVIHKVRLHSVHHRTHAAAVGNVALYELDVVQNSAERREVRARPHEPVHARTRPLGQQRPGNVGADHPGDAGDQHSRLISARAAGAGGGRGNRDESSEQDDHHLGARARYVRRWPQCQR